MDKIAVLIPCYNESKTVEKVVSDFRRVLPDATVYVYDNNSTDGTAELAAGAGAVVRHEYQQGKGNVMRRMFREIDAEAYILVDGDDTYPAEAAPEMVAAVTERQADMVVGDRLSSTYYTQNKRPFHNFGNDLVRFFTNHLFGGKIKDIMTGYRAFSYQFVKTYPVLSRGFEVETEMTIHSLNNNLRLYEMPIQYRDRPEGSVSKLDTVGDGIKVMSTFACGGSSSMGYKRAGCEVIAANDIEEDGGLDQLIINRERRVKGNRRKIGNPAYIYNKRNRIHYYKLTYRWETVKVFAEELRKEAYNG